MATPTTTTGEPVEAIIISGARKGETREVEAALDQMAHIARSITEDSSRRRTENAEAGGVGAEFATEQLRALRRQMGELRADVDSIRERIVRLEATREADRRQLLAGIKQFKAETERALLRQARELLSPTEPQQPSRRTAR